jgi:hypothetical protein
LILKNTVDVYHWFWDDYNEGWYVKHCKSLESGSMGSEARTSKQWKKDMRGYAPVRDFQRVYRLLCTDVIDPVA